MTFVALLRGINVGGNTLVPMRALKEVFEKLGFGSVKTYINSGNVVFEASRTSPRILEGSIENALEKRFGTPIRVVVKSRAEMKTIVDALPKEWRDTKKWRANVIFLSHRIDKPSITKDVPFNPAVETVTYGKGALFWAVTWSGATKSKVAKVNRLPIYKEMTVRNPNTTRTIYELMCER
jgi:uncharacterized protein (DUF1697 family)